MAMFIFWFLFFLIVFHYVIFPIITIIMSLIFRKPIKIQEIYPTVSLIVAAYNEERVIKKKIENCLALDYPIDQLEIIVISDGSTDNTPKIVDNYKAIKGLHQPERQGKTAALNRAVEKATGKIIVFSDANSMYEPKAIKFLCRNFHDSSVGAVCGRKSIVKNLERESSRGDTMFWNFESTIKVLQSKIGSITTGDGEIFAIRRHLYEKVPEEIINDDTAITFDIIRKGYRVIYEPEAISKEEASIVLEDDFNVKARMVSGGYQTLAYYSSMLFPPKNYFAFQFIAHKVLRWCMPLLLILLFIANIFILKGFYLLFFCLQLLFYLLAGYAYYEKSKNHNISILYVPLYYCSMNLAALYGFYYFLRRDKVINIWKKAER